MFLNTPTNRFLTDRKYEVLYPPTYGVYTGRLNYLKASGKFWSARVSDCIVAHKGKIFIGNGDYDKNTGACPICSYDPPTNKWTIEGTLPTEQILRIREIDDTLWIPCIDHVGGDADARVFRRNNDGTWTTISIPFPAQHSFNIIKWNDKIWMDIAQTPDSEKAAVAVSGDGGDTWNKIRCYQANGSTVTDITNPRLEGGLYLVGNDLCAIGSLDMMGSSSVSYKYNSVSNKFIRQADSENYLPSGESMMGRMFGLKRNCRNRRYKTSITGNPQVEFVGSSETSFLGRRFLCTVSFIDHENSTGIYSSQNYATKYYFSKTCVFFTREDTTYMNGYMPAVGMFSDMTRSLTVDGEDGWKYIYSRDVIDVFANDDRLYFLQVRTERSGRYKSPPYKYEQLIAPFVVSIYSTSDFSSYRLDFESTFPTWPTCFTVLDDFAYICMGGDLHLESHWVGAVVKAKLNS